MAGMSGIEVVRKIKERAIDEDRYEKLRIVVVTGGLSDYELHEFQLLGITDIRKQH
jgi:CheY-like chemotaxis protein